jgi:hypothetical protein
MGKFIRKREGERKRFVVYILAAKKFDLDVKDSF